MKTEKWAVLILVITFLYFFTSSNSKEKQRELLLIEAQGSSAKYLGKPFSPPFDDKEKNDAWAKGYRSAR